MAGKRIAILAAGYRHLSHAQQLADRFFLGYPRDGRWHRPAVQVAALHGTGDLVAERAREFGSAVHTSVAEAVRGVEGVLVVDERGESLRPLLAAFASAGRGAAVALHPRLAPLFDDVRALADAARRLRFPVLAGTALPYAYRLPALDMPAGAKVEEAVATGYAASESARYQMVDALVAMLERRRGGETGVAAVRLVEGPAVWQDAALCPRDLLTAALSRGDSPQGLTLQDGRTQDLVGSGEVQRLATKPVACRIEYRDGTRATVLLLDGASKDFTFGARIAGRGTLSTQFLLAPPPNATHTERLAEAVEDLFVTGRSAAPAARAVLVSGILEAAEASRARGGGRVETPRLALRSAPQ